ncbi:alpha/beta fold hydrolase [Loigolactobacillus jiayinensis]|uniref:Alpha/beta fold hydrolase n=1 Tax=Loigolactobacillus jiayinensis TaxID=2486016 RepID=A0ABW1RFY3_9LACO|nr:alpha/beta fold hydrolase [Loigolactobacillus jiayinensis]
MKKWRRWVIGLFGTFCVAALLLTWYQQRQNSRYLSSTTATVFVHGWRGTAHSTDQMITAAEEAGAAKKVLTVTVSPQGKLIYSGYWRKGQRNPIIQVIFSNNYAGEVQYTKWLVKLMRDLKQRYDVKAINLVGHSMGAYAVVAYAMQAGKQPAFPRLNKLVAIAGPFDGIVGQQSATHPKDGTTWTDRPHKNHLQASGEPLIVHSEYLRLEHLRRQFPHQAKVLNIYGDLKDGTASDKVVTVVSATSLRYLVAKRAASYQTQKVTGPNAEHSRLHQNNPVVDGALIAFLWGK